MFKNFATSAIQKIIKKEQKAPETYNCQYFGDYPCPNISIHLFIHPGNDFRVPTVCHVTQTLCPQDVYILVICQVAIDALKKNKEGY